MIVKPSSTVSAPAPRLTAGTGRRAAAVPWDRRLVWVLLAAAGLRLLLGLALGNPSLRADEIQYQEIAVNLVDGHGFAMQGRLTSWRPPLYPFVLSRIYLLAGTTDPMVARIFQIVLSLGIVLIVFLLGRRLFGPNAAVVAAILFAAYPSFLFYNHHLLTEVLYTFLLTATACCFASYLDTRRLGLAAASGVLLGLAALTRDVILPMLVPMTLLAVHAARANRRRAILHGVILVLGTSLVVTPWIVRNTREQGVLTSIATNGGPSFLAGNNPHTPSDRPWQYHDFDAELRWRSLVPKDVSEGERQRLAYRLGIEFIRDHPGLTLRRAVIKASNVWGLEREILGTALGGGYGGGRSLVFVVAPVILGAYAVVLLAGLTGLSFATAAPGPARPFHLFVVMLLLFTTAVHALAFGHPRYHLPLVPLLCVYAGHAYGIRARIWQARRTMPFLVAAVLAAVLAASWLREIFLVELDRLLRAFTH